MAKIIVYEGADKAGKGTQSRLLTKNLIAEGYKVVKVEPSKEANKHLTRAIYYMLETGLAKRYPTFFQFTLFINKLLFQTFRLPRLMKQYDVIVIDRWALSGYVYGIAEGVNHRFNKWMYERIKSPDVTIVLSGTSHKRKSEEVDDSYEKDQGLQSKVRTLYRSVASWPNHLLVDNHDSIDDVQASIRAALHRSGIVRYKSDQ